MKTLGASNKFFYYTAHDLSTFNIRFGLRFTKEFDPDIMKQSVMKAMELYPEFAQRIYKKDNCLEAKQITKDVCFYKDDDSRKVLGSDETNGYMMYFRYGPKYLETAIYHGLTDAMGMLEFIRCFLCFYFLQQGEEFSDEELETLRCTIRSSKQDFEMGDKEDLLNPYEKYVNVNSKFYWDYSGADSYSIPSKTYPDEIEYINNWEISLPVSQFLGKTKEYGVSAVPLLSDIISGSVKKAFNVTDESVVAMVPVNFRPYFDSNTKVNFSDGIQIPYEKGDELLSHQERCAKMKEMMRSQINRENFEAIITSKVKAVESIENSGNLFDRPKGRKPFTIAMTYPGKVDFTPGLDKRIDDFYLTVFSGSYAVVAYSYADTLKLSVSARTDDETYVNAIAKGFEEMGFDVTLRKCGYSYPDQVKVENL